MSVRPSDEEHRVATPLELLFDLCFAVAIAQAGREFSTAVAHDQIGHGLASFATVFFAIWWPWMNYSWFASGFDPDDVPFRLATFAQIAGALVIAAGVPRAFEHQDITVVVIGYVIVRLAFATQLIRVYRDNPEMRGMTARWCGGVLVVQLAWVLQQLLHGREFQIAFGVLVVAELAVPFWASRSRDIPFHPRHIVERYGCFTLIVLGETVAAATVAIQEATTVHGHLATLIALAVGGLLIVFAAWWIYFAYDAADLLSGEASAWGWGYGHYFVFASAAGIGAGIQVCAAWLIGAAHVSAVVAASVVTVPSALFFVLVWLLQARHFKTGWAQAVLPAAAVAILLCTFAGRYAVVLAGLCCAACVGVGLYERRLQDAKEAASGA
ncbi:low temperature requirement protein LtrA [Streptacidiphilus sp. MAP12-33]|uniref:low temperature requirement protein A n=1 Tax=Streptacidiphilus sp. MAP12-33 TaxID=3156266 RepID=UPI0035131374